ncbi:MAG: hypothetical protein JSW71_19140 [Gemmatimonadota bacterium]|nr:MAG: hypothetical protein JSW71_19140 [Gemmatimonadota bacterium]
MRYFHRTALPPDTVLEEADKYFPAWVSATDSGKRHRSYSGTAGRISLHVEAEGGHYTLITVETDQVGESEADKIAKRFLTTVHQRLEPSHIARGAY